MNDLKKGEYVAYAQRCEATWLVMPVKGGTAFKIKCRRCGTLLCSGGTPKCLINQPKEI